jgi:hypothetical protein
VRTTVASTPRRSPRWPSTYRTRATACLSRSRSNQRVKPDRQGRRRQFGHWRRLLCARKRRRGVPSRSSLTGARRGRGCGRSARLGRERGFRRRARLSAPSAVLRGRLRRSDDGGCPDCRGSWGSWGSWDLWGGKTPEASALPPGTCCFRRRPNDMDAAFMLLQRHERGIHVVFAGSEDVSAVTEVAESAGISGAGPGGRRGGRARKSRARESPGARWGGPGLARGAGVARGGAGWRC